MMKKILLYFFALLPYTGKCLMDSLVLRPQGAGDYMELTYTGGLSPSNALQDGSDVTSGVNYIYSTADAQRASLSTSITGQLTTETIDSVIVQVRCKTTSLTGGGSIFFSIKSTNHYYTISPTALTTTFANYRNTWVNNPHTSSAWTVSELQSVECGIKTSELIRHVWFSELWFIIYYHGGGSTSFPTKQLLLGVGK